MKVEIYDQQTLQGSVSLDLSDPNATLQVDGDEGFRDYIRHLKRRMSDREFIEGLTSRLRSLVHAVLVER